MLRATELDLAAQVVNYVLALPLLILGIVGVILSIVVFSSQISFRRNTTIVYLLAGSILAGIHLIIVDIQRLLADGFKVRIFNINIDICRERTYLMSVTTISAICFPCWAAFDQYAGTSHDATFRNRWRSLRFVRLAIVSTILFWTLIYIPIIFTSEIIFDTCQIKQTPYKTLNTYVLTPLVYTVVPATVMIYFTRATIQNLRSNNIHIAHAHLAKQVRRMLILQLLLLIISGVPYVLEGIYFYLTFDIERNVDQLALENLVDQTILLLYHVNFTFTFYMYAFVSSKIRKALRHQILQCLIKIRLISRTIQVGNFNLFQAHNRRTAPLPN